MVVVIDLLLRVGRIEIVNRVVYTIAGSPRGIVLTAVLNLYQFVTITAYNVDSNYKYFYMVCFIRCYLRTVC